MAIGQPQRVLNLCERQRADKLLNETAYALIPFLECPNPIFQSIFSEKWAVELAYLCHPERKRRISSVEIMRFFELKLSE